MHCFGLFGLYECVVICYLYRVSIVKGNKMNVSISKASQLTGAARSTIYKDIDEGTLSVEVNARGKKEINIAELERVYGLAKADAVAEKQVSKNVATVVDRIEAPVSGGGGQIAVLQERLESQRLQIKGFEEKIDMINGERKRERDQYKDQLDSLQKALDNAQDGQNKLTLMLEHKEGEGADRWQESIKAIESRIANQEAKAKADEERTQKVLRQNQMLKKALDEERKKSFWQKLFG